MPIEKTIKLACLLKHGAIQAFDANNDHIHYVEGSYSMEKHKRILLEACDDCELLGFDVLPTGFITVVEDFAIHYRIRNLNWNEIHTKQKDN